MADLVVFGASKPSSPGTSRRVWLVAVAGWLPFNQKSEEYVQGIFDHGKHALETIGHTVVSGFKSPTGGTIEERVEEFFHIPHADAIRAAEAIIFCAHSQGVPITHMIRHGLFQRYKHLLVGKIVGSLFLAGISAGTHEPLCHATRNLLACSTQQLSELSEPLNDLCKKVVEARTFCARQGCRDVYVHAFGDEVVPFRSSIELQTFTPSVHSRAVVYESSSAQDPFLRLQRLFICATNHGYIFHPMFGDALDNALPASSCFRIIEMVISFITRAEAPIARRHSDVWRFLDVYLTGIRFLLNDETAHLPLQGRAPPFLPNRCYQCLADFFLQQLVALAGELEIENLTIWMDDERTLLGETNDLISALRTGLKSVQDAVGRRWWDLEDRWRRRAQHYDCVMALEDLLS